MDELARKTNRLQLTDSTNETGGNSKGEQRADKGSDEELAWTLYRQEQEDEKLAAKLENGNTEVMRRFRHFQRQAEFITRDAHVHSDPMAESSAQAAKRAAQKVPPKTAACVAGMEVFAWNELAEAPCGHNYCRGCVSGLFRNATTDESLFPPRCCRQVLSLEKLTPFLDDDLATRFSAKAIEFSTPVRTYCHDARCSAFIPPSSIRGEVARCPECWKRTCTMCKAARHHGDCPQDTALQQVLEVAQGEGACAVINSVTTVDARGKSVAALGSMSDVFTSALRRLQTVIQSHTVRLHRQHSAQSVSNKWRLV
ncbi:hypothetical protein D0866_07384 [Hortaea werneckii]|nr:hypothetical protein D0866_07384 [Hortaea werneckii]